MCKLSITKYKHITSVITYHFTTAYVYRYNRSIDCIPNIIRYIFIYGNTKARVLVIDCIPNIIRYIFIYGNTKARVLVILYIVFIFYEYQSVS